METSTNVLISNYILENIKRIVLDSKTCYTCIHAYMNTCIKEYMHTCIHAYINRYLRANMHTCINAYMKTFIHSYMHTYIYA